jgi:alpha-glucosidase
LHNNIVSVTSNVTNGKFALDKKWIIEKVTFLGIPKHEKLNRIDLVDTESELNVVNRMSSMRKGVLNTKFDNSSQFAIVEVSNLKQLIGEEFKLVTEIR